MFCPFIQGECNSNCVFRCRPCAVSQSMMQPSTECLIAKKLDYLNDMQQDQLSEILSSLEEIR